MPKLMDLKHTPFGNKVCVQIDDFAGSSWEFLDTWIAHNTLIRIKGNYRTLTDGITLYLRYDVNWTDEITGRACEDWRDILRAVQITHDWDEINKILKSTVVSRNESNCD